MTVVKYIKNFLKPFVPKKVKLLRRTLYSIKPISSRECPICSYLGCFEHFGRPPRLDAMCPSCGSLERHRLLFISLNRNLLNEYKPIMQGPILHFAAEKVLENFFRRSGALYETADLFEKADLTLNMEDMNVSDEKYNVVIANHVLEHVDDYKACTEVRRVLKPNGLFISMVPIIEGWESTYEKQHVTTDNERMLHFGQEDHVRYYGKDFRERVQSSGLKLVHEFTAEGKDVIRYGLLRGEKVFVFQK